jgi:hypothetical protein
LMVRNGLYRVFGIGISLANDMQYHVPYSTNF